MTDCRTVCKICYASSSHKPSPTLSSEAKVTYDTSVPSKRMCTVCRMEWAPIRVAKEPSGPLAGRWVRIRPRPRISPSTEFQMCKNAQGKLECPRGQDCSYAHSKSELAVWNEEREREPRPAPPITGPYSYQLCKHVQNFGSCPYGQRCTFAHSEEELREWFRSTSVQAAAGPVPGAGGGGGGGGFGIVGGPLYRCDICNLTCTSRKQLEDHFSGGKHKQQQQQMQQQQFQPPRLAYSVPHPPHGVQRDFCGVRKKPFLSTPVNGFKMCMHILSNRRCVYGDFCTFAHTNEELEVWNRPRGVALYHHQQPPAQVGMRFQRAAPLQAPPVQPVSASDNSVPIPSVMNHQKPNIFAAASGLDDFEEGMDEFAETHDFADDLRARIIEEHNRKQDIGGFEKSHSDACVEEITGQPLSLAWSQPDSLQWTFEVSTTAAKILHSVTLFDTLATDFNILGAWLVLYGGQQRPLPGTVSLQGSGLQLKQRIAPPDKVHIKISLKPRSGILGQLVVFDFGSFFLARGLMVHVFNEVERNLVVNMGGRKRFRPAKPDLYWEQHYTPFTMPGHEEDEVFDKALPEYPLPEQIEKLIETGKYNNVENRVTKENYKRRMHNLLYLEEYQQRVDMSRYDLYDIEITPENSYSTPLGGMQYAADGFYYVTVSVEEVLYEGGRSIRSNDLALLLPMNQQVIHECGIEGVGRDTVILKITEKAKQAATASRNRCSLRFVLSRTHMREMHYAVDHLDLNVVFPTPRSGDVNDPPFSSSLSKCVSELKNTKLYQTQQNAINSMLDPACRQIPSLVLGPFGCGKTRTLRDCIMLLSLLVEDTTILICTHSNSAANIYVQELHREYNKRGIERVSMLRIYYTRRRTSTIPEIVKLYCNMENGSLALPSIAELKQYKIVVVTLSTSRALSLMGLPKGHFSHIFIDEAAQALESETLIPLTLANENTKVVLAGDHMQMDPPCYSEIARRYNLHVSLLERLYDHEAYNQGVGQLCKTLLTENYRSHPHILALPSKLFYKDKLTCRAEFPNTGPKNIPALKFVGVDGQEGQDDDSPSYYNDHEGLKAVEQVKLLVMGGLNQDEICVLSYYQKQVSRIRQLLRNEKLRQVSVYRVDDVQGKEYRALILSTVRTCSTNEKNLEEDAGFLTNPKLFNTAVTRAKEWLIVCGEPITLCTVGSNRICWLELIKKAHYELGSFEYQNAAQFERCLETKLIARQILDKRSEPFFRKMKQMLNPPADSQPSPVAMTTQEVPTTAAQNSQHLSFLQAPPHLRQQMMRSKVTELSHGSDQSTVNKITEELTKLSVQDQGALLARPELLTQRVHELETILARAGPTAALLSATSGPSPVVGQGTQLNSAMAPSQGGVYSTGTLGSQKTLGAIAPDLPPFLTSIIDGLTNYMKWCDVHLQNPQNNRPGVKENLRKQRTNLEQQTKLVNEQIHMYRELLKIVRTSQTPVRPTVSPSTGIPSQGPPSGPVRMGPQQIPPQQIPQQQQLLQGAPGGMQQFMSRPPQPFASGLPPMSAAVHHQQQMAQQMQQQQQQQHMHVQQLQQQQQLHLQHQQHLQHQHLQQQMYQKQMVGMVPPMQAPPITNTVGMTPNITPGASNFGGPHVAPFQPGKALSEVPRHSAPPSGNISSGPQAHPPQGQQLNPGHTYPAGPAPQASQSRMPSHPHSSSAFAFGVSPYFPNAQPDEPLTQLSVQTNLGSKPMGKGLSPLAAAINDASSRSSPLPYPQDTTDVYLSDDEFNS